MKTGIKKRKLIKTKWPGVFIDPDLDKVYEGRTISPERRAAIEESLRKPGFPGITAPETRLTADKLHLV